jgi:hypothetical protein
MVLALFCHWILAGKKTIRIIQSRVSKKLKKYLFHSTRATLRSTSHTHNNTYYDRKQHDNKRVDKAQTTIKLELCVFLESKLFYEVESLPRGSSDVY